jgi:inositol transport system substrate-binding protein
MKISLAGVMAAFVLSLGLGCGGSGAASKRSVVGVAFETLQTEYWVASHEAIRAELSRRGVEVVEAVADGDPNRQLEQIHSFIARKVDGIIIIPKDADTVVPMIRAANRARIPIVLYNRGPAENSGRYVAIVADNRAITRRTVGFMVEEARKSARKRKAMILIGDLGDENAYERREGFEEVVRESSDVIEVVARVPTDWNQEKALAGATNALQANPDIDFVFVSSDFLFPAVVSALKKADRFRKIGEAGHVILGGFDGDATAYQMLTDGYLDADGVQDVAFECSQAVDAVLGMKAGKSFESVLHDPGFVVHQGNLEAEAHRMWGSKVASR